MWMKTIMKSEVSYCVFSSGTFQAVTINLCLMEARSSSEQCCLFHCSQLLVHIIKKLQQDNQLTKKKKMGRRRETRTTWSPSTIASPIVVLSLASSSRQQAYDQRIFSNQKLSNLICHENQHFVVFLKIFLFPQEIKPKLRNPRGWFFIHLQPLIQFFYRIGHYWKGGCLFSLPADVNPAYLLWILDVKVLIRFCCWESFILIMAMIRFLRSLMSIGGGSKLLHLQPSRWSVNLLLGFTLYIVCYYHDKWCCPDLDESKFFFIPKTYDSSVMSFISNFEDNLVFLIILNSRKTN